MILGIDATNLRRGGGITHLVELLRAANPATQGVERVVVWGGEPILNVLQNRSWLVKRNPPALDKGLLKRMIWQYLHLSDAARDEGCDVLFVPGGSYAGDFHPVVTMSQNLLPFEWRESRRFGWSFYALKFILLRWVQSSSFRKSDGVVFLTQYALDAVQKVTGPLQGKSGIVPHGINSRFIQLPRAKRLAVDFTNQQPCRVLYVSIIDVYKHQWKVAEAVAQLRSGGIPIMLELIGPPARGMSRLKETLNRIDPEGLFITYRGPVPYEELDKCYENADIGVFASSCENLPNILIEGMASGLPMACSDLGPMPEVLGDAGVYFNPEDSSSIAGALNQLIEAPDLRARMAHAAFERAQAFSWGRCANGTFRFLVETFQRHKGIN